MKRILIYGALGYASITFCWIEATQPAKLAACLKLAQSLRRSGVQVQHISGWTKTLRIKLSAESLAWLQANASFVVYGAAYLEGV